MAPDRSPAEFFVARAVGLRLPPCPVRHGLRLALTCACRPALQWVMVGLACMACAWPVPAPSSDGLWLVCCGWLCPCSFFFAIRQQDHAVQVLAGRVVGWRLVVAPICGGRRQRVAIERRSREKKSFLRNYLLWGHKLLSFGSKNRELLEMDSFLPPYTYLECWQKTSFSKKIL